MTRMLSLLLLVGVSFTAAGSLPAQGDPAPDFSLPDQSGVTRSLTDYRGSWLLVYFYPKDDTPGCTTEACQFRDHITVLNALGVKVVGISLDDSASHAAFATKHELPFALLADTDGAVTTRYGALRDLLVVRFARRYSFLINPEGLITRRYLEVDPEDHADQVVMDVRELLKLAEGATTATIDTN